MLLRKYWIPLSVFIVAIVGVSLYYLQTRPPKEPILIVKPVEYEKSPAKAPVGDTSQGGHFHADGTWHSEPHETPVDRPVLPPRQAQETPKFVKPVSDSQDVTIAKQVAASDAVPDRGELEAMSDEQLNELMDESLEKVQVLAPEMFDKMRELAKTEGDLTRHAKTRAENDAILAENADLLQPLREAKASAVWEYLVYQQTARRASKILNVRFFIEASDFVDPDSLTDEFWAAYWSDF